MSLNKVLLIGNLGKDAEVRAAGNAQVASLTVATTEKYKKQDGTAVENTEWHNCELWNPGNILPYLRKGTQVYIEGSIRTDEVDRNGTKAYYTKIRVLHVELLGGKPQAQQPAAQQYAQPQYQQPAAPQYAPQAPQYQQPYAPQAPQAPQYAQPQPPQYPAPGGNPLP